MDNHRRLLKKNIMIRLGLCSILVATLFFRAGAVPRMAFWYWGTGIIPERFNRLTSLPVQDIFLKCGDIYLEKGEYRYKPVFIPKDYSFTTDRTSLHLVIPCIFQKPVNKVRFLALLQKIIREEEKELSSHGVVLNGIQFDLEGRISIDDYRDLLEGVKPLIKKFKVSACFYPPYLSQPGIQGLLKYFDFISVMFYDYRFDFQDYRPTDADWINQTLPEIKKLGIPFYLGLPVYGMITVFNHEKKLVYQQVDLPDMTIFNKPVFKHLEPRDAVIQRYELQENFSYKYLHFQKGWYFIVCSPGLTQVRDLIKTIGGKKEKCLGYSFFSYPLTDKYNIKEKDMGLLLKDLK